MSDLNFEQQLKLAMRRVDAPENLAKRLALATEAPQQREERAARSAPWLPRTLQKLRGAFELPAMAAWSPARLGGAMAAVLLVAVLGLGGLHVRQEHERARVAEKNFEISQQITEDALEHTREQLQKAGVPLDGSLELRRIGQ